MTDIDIRKLAKLSRIEVSDSEVEQLEKQIPEILSFVEQIQDAGGEVKKETGDHYNVFREDENPHESGVYSEDLIEAMPKHSEDGYLQVKKIIAQD